GCHTVRQPQLEDVIGRHALPGVHVMKVQVRIDESRQDVSTVQIDFSSSIERRPAFGIYGKQRRADTVDGRDAVVLDNEINRASRRCAGTVDQIDTAQYQALVGTVALVTAGDVIGAGLG